MVALPSSYHLHKAMIHLVLRALQAGGAFVAMLTATAVTGLSYADYSLVVAYTGWMASMGMVGLLLLHKVPVVYPTKTALLAHDAVLGALLFIAGIAMAASKMLSDACKLQSAFDLTNGINCSSYRASTAFLFIVAVLHLISFGLTMVDYSSPKVPMEDALDMNDAFSANEPRTPRGEYPGEYVPPQEHLAQV
ncbi:hypothetical protein SPRG_05788 [Saprolegnia parasitica CBS 223.65]|uniref:MARVEL domain-containing protein n=1 Tax=Saprolegnia parasitica (strain CBS 223.65) TaxID=695850 RepID=A0A067CQ24_SAPPC|nr:hypothetical protein SPRG_05788 [Saprolegnia parasitica CBS 223.65]KDO28917.1 hypothetical protein SPRG_05788 [Saprolegnia parasitica CBS 223.65]|eukprot:XP_012200460.1 hypothetical protein SPRG_05788 [Saprolegnia parasitica CBS 223.65]